MKMCQETEKDAKRVQTSLLMTIETLPPGIDPDAKNVSDAEW